MRNLSRSILLLALAANTSWAQTTVHQHYAKDARSAEPAADGRRAPRLQSLGSHKFPVTTRSAEAQKFVDQGLNLSYGFNHAEAGRAFAEAARLDPRCAMAFWGQALVLGPNINSPMDPADGPKALALVTQAMALRSGVSARERGYIEALARRYEGGPERRAACDSAYARAMREHARRFPADLDAQALWVEAAMDLRPWNYWRPDGTPYPGTLEIRSRLEDVIAKDPNHPGALHFYIHLLEPTAEAYRAEPAADRLLTLVPGAGHLVHMSSHIYQRVGRYADAARSNELAIAADEDYITQCRAQGMYPMAYYPHNIHFLWFAATMQGRSQVAIAAARKTAAQVSDSALAATPLLAGFRVVPWYALTRFGKWDDMLAEPAPPPANRFMTGTWAYARGLALIAKQRRDEAAKMLDTVKAIAADTALEFTLFSPNTARAILSVAPEVLAGELDASRGNHESAIAHFERAVMLEDALVYTEPEEWHYPPRQALGAELLAAGRAREAEVIYWQDLRKHPENGWSLYGLAQAQAAQGRAEQAADTRARFEKAWAQADLELKSSRVAPR
jgi:tetratricopeptide (TPR) repeat protein